MIVTRSVVLSPRFRYREWVWETVELEMTPALAFVYRKDQM